MSTDKIMRTERWWSVYIEICDLLSNACRNNSWSACTRSALEFLEESVSLSRFLGGIFSKNLNNNETDNTIWPTAPLGLRERRREDQHQPKPANHSWDQSFFLHHTTPVDGPIQQTSSGSIQYKISYDGNIGYWTRWSFTFL